MNRVKQATLLFGLAVVILGTGAGILLDSVLASTPQEGGKSETQNLQAGEETEWKPIFMALSAALVTSLGCLGAAYAVARVGAAAMGAASEKPELLGRSLLFVGLAEGIAIYGLIVGIMLLMKIV